MKFSPLILITLFGVISCQENISNINEEKIFQGFMNFIINYSKNYSSLDELKLRYSIFKENMLTLNITDYIFGNSSNSTDPDDGWTMGVSPYSDLTPDEFGHLYLTFTNNTLPDDIQTYDFNSEDELNFLSSNQTQGRTLQSLPSSWDWRSYGAVTAVKNQGACGACWTFAAIGNIEGLYYIKHRRSVQFSEQQILDCNYSGKGCGGGTSAEAFYYVNYSGGIMLSRSYPYLGYKSYCRFQLSQVAAKITGFVSAGTTDENSILRMLYKTGPLAVAMNARPLQFYSGGVFNVSRSQCNPYKLNHAVTLVGYGTTSSGRNYWIVKNSWGSNWGESGFFRIARGGGVCGINLVATSAIIQ
jgi:cathepsin F